MTRQPAAHGTRSRYNTCTAGPDGGKCADCREANRRYIEAGRRARGVRPLADVVAELRAIPVDHGTSAGYHRCTDDGGRACADCRAGHAAYVRERNRLAAVRTG